LEKSRLDNKEKEGLKNESAKDDLGVTRDSTTRVWGAVPKPS